MGAVYALLGLVIGVALDEIVHWRVLGGREQSRAQAGLRGRRSPAALPTYSRQAPHPDGGFAAWDYYDR